jgi:hypothetical protein
MERSGGGRENEGILVAVRMKQQHGSSGIAGFILNKTKKKKNGTKMQAPKLRFDIYVQRFIRPWE